MPLSVPLCGLFAGPINELLPGLPSAIHKSPCPAAVHLGLHGLEGDAQADRRHHGGPDRALHHYPAEHYPVWAAELPGFRHQAPAFGENLSTLGMTEAQVHIGDVYRLGEAVIQVSQPRSPCHKLNHRFGHPDMARRVQDSGRCGWLYRVLEPGRVDPGCALVPLRSGSGISVAEAMAILFLRPFDAERYALLQAAQGLSASWRRTLENRLVRRSIESWRQRLFGA